MEGGGLRVDERKKNEKPILSFFSHSFSPFFFIFLFFVLCAVLLVLFCFKDKDKDEDEDEDKDRRTEGQETQKKHSPQHISISVPLCESSL